MRCLSFSVQDVDALTCICVTAKDMVGSARGVVLSETNKFKAVVVLAYFAQQAPDVGARRRT